jgi:tetraacyldisaccharide-1-P 4'-kinase
LKHLLRADYLVVTKGQGDNKELYEVLSAHTRRSVFERLIECQTRYGVTTDLLTGAAQPISLQSRILAVSGIGSPEPFEQAVQTQFAPREVRSLRYRDHYNYALKDLHSIGHLAQDFDWVVTTEKDAIKLRSLIVSTGFAAGNRWRVLPMIFEASASIERLYENIRSLALSSL